MAKKPQPSSTKVKVIEVQGKSFQAMVLEPGKQYLIGFDREKVTMETAVAVLQSLEQAGNRNVTAIMCDGDPRQSVVFYELPEPPKPNDELVGQIQ